jgi:hypothetical protein
MARVLRHHADLVDERAQRFRPTGARALGSERIVELMVHALSALETKVNLMAIGVEHGRLAQSQRIVPLVQTAMSGAQTFILRSAALTREQCAFCIGFVVDVATGVERRKSE